MKSRACAYNSRLSAGSETDAPSIIVGRKTENAKFDVTGGDSEERKGGDGMSESATLAFSVSNASEIATRILECSE